MVLYPNCKINIGLRVLRQRPDGYRDLSTLFYPVYGLHDTLQVERSDSFVFDADGIQIDCPTDDNLIIRCYHLMQSTFSAIGSVHIRLTKHIPFGAGLGGGSSDATHMAIALNTIFNLGLTTPQLAALVRPLGADCPFFAYNSPCYAEGIGDQLTPVEMDLSDYRIVMIKPDVNVSTREAYAHIQLHPEAAGTLPQAIERWHITGHLDPQVWVNDFEQSVFPLHPQLGYIKQRLLEAGACYAAMSGSGSTLFGLFKNDAESRSDTLLRTLYEEFASMIIFDDTLAKAQS